MRSPHPATAARRNPVQERSQETVNRVLKAASRLLAASAIEDITTSRIAAEADLSVGALYRFFPDKQAILDAIAVAHVERFRGAVEQRLAISEFASGPDFLGMLIDAFSEFLDQHPDFRAIAFGHVSQATRQRQTDPDAPASGLLKRFMLESLGMKEPEKLNLELRIAIEAGERLIAFAYEQPDLKARAEVLTEVKRLLSAYLFA